MNKNPQSSSSQNTLRCGLAFLRRFKLLADFVQVSTPLIIVPRTPDAMQHIHHHPYTLLARNLYGFAIERPIIHNVSATREQHVSDHW